MKLGHWFLSSRKCDMLELDPVARIVDGVLICPLSYADTVLTVRCHLPDITDKTAYPVKNNPSTGEANGGKDGKQSVTVYLEKRQYPKNLILVIFLDENPHLCGDYVELEVYKGATEKDYRDYIKELNEKYK